MIKLNEKEVEFGSFPNGEVWLKMQGLDVRAGLNFIGWMYEDDGDFFKLAALKSYLDEMNADVAILVHYMPYSRMDRANGIYTVTCPVAVKLLDNMGFKDISIREPHSGQCLIGWQGKQPHYYQWTAPWTDALMKKDGWDSIFFPDYGAVQRYGNSPTHEYGYGKKTRDFGSGNIERYEICGKVGQRVLIIDDLCSRGGTFIEAAHQLKMKGALSVGLLVAVCENNVHTGRVFDYIDRIYTSKDNCLLESHPRITFL